MILDKQGRIRDFACKYNNPRWLIKSTQYHYQRAEPHAAGRSDETDALAQDY